jgi:hypothetical protein
MKTVDEYMAMLTEPLSADQVRYLVEIILKEAEDEQSETFVRGVNEGMSAGGPDV